MQNNIHKSLIRDFYRRAVNQGDLAFADQLIADDYIQHSQAIKAGKAGIMEALQMMKQMPKPPATSTPFFRLIAEGNFVVTNLSFDWGGKQKIVVDLFRFENGKAAEHWDAVQDQPETTANGHALMDGPMPIEDAGLTVRNKKIAGDFYQRIFIEKHLKELPDYVAADLIQHHPGITLDGLRNFFDQNVDSVVIARIKNIIAEGDFVVIQSEGSVARKPTLFYVIFRLSAGKVVEQWEISQQID